LSSSSAMMIAADARSPSRRFLPQLTTLFSASSQQDIFK